MSPFLLAPVLASFLATAAVPPAPIPTPMPASDDAPAAVADAIDAQPPDDNKPPTPPHTGPGAVFSGLIDDIKHLPSKRTLYLTLGGGALALAVHPADAKLNNTLGANATAAEAFWKPGHIVGDIYVQIGGTIVTFAAGRILHQPKVSHLGMDLLRAQIIAGGLTTILKVTVRRERPDHSDAYSFPSGHAAAAFATATVIERHMGWQYAGLGYAVAAYVATSRLHDNVHVLSDVVFGATVGTIAGRTIVQHGRNAWTLTPVPTPGGAAIVITRQPR